MVNIKIESLFIIINHPKIFQHEKELGSIFLHSIDDLGLISGYSSLGFEVGSWDKLGQDRLGWFSLG
jgi:hypothetical protein